MKKLLLILAVVIAVVACEKYEEYEVNTVGFTAVYFPKQELKRSAISGEGMQISIGAYIGGLRTNDKDWTVNFEVVDSLVGDYELLPADYYTLSSSNEIVIPAGSFQGLIDVKFDSAKFAADDLVKDFHYAIPLAITSTSADSVLLGKDIAVFPIKMMNTFEGNFYQVGQVKKFYTVKPVLDDAYALGDTLDYPNSEVVSLATESMNGVMTKHIGEFGGEGFNMILTVDGSNNVTFSAPEGAKAEVMSNGTNTWDPVKRTFDLNYKFTYNDRNYEVSEKLIFRNRIRDGLNEWRWKGFPGN